MRNVRESGDLARTRALWTAGKPSQSAAPAYVADPPPWWHAGVALATALLVQVSFGPALALRGAGLPLVSLVACWYAVRAGTLRGLAFGLIAGACEDAFAGTTGAAWTFATALAGLCAGRFSRSWAADFAPALCAGAALFTLGRYAVFAAIMQLEGHPLALPGAHAHAALWQGLEAGAIAAVVLRRRPDLARTAPLGRAHHAHGR